MVALLLLLPISSGRSLEKVSAQAANWSGWGVRQAGSRGRPAGAEGRGSFAWWLGAEARG